MKFATVASGISAETFAWKPLGWQAQFYSEIEPFASAVLNHHYAETPNLGDMNLLQQHTEYHEAVIDVLAGGTPCQGFSLAGRRGGLDDPRSGLALRFLDIIEYKRPRWVVWENVPDVLSSAGGKDFYAFISGLEARGYGVAWRILDAQYFGLAQRRRRLFLIGCLGDWRPAVAVLFDRASVQGHPAPGRKKRESTTYEIAPCLRGCGVGGERIGDTRGADPVVAIAGTLVNGGKSAGSVTNQDIDQGLIIPEVSRALLEHGSHLDYESETLIAHALTASAHKSGGATAGNNPGIVNAIVTYNRVRRLTPIEYERLMGFPDNYTQVTYRGRPAEKCADGPRYRALGNSIATPVLKWIGERMQMVEDLKKQQPCR